jgi:formamidopyrimidine-DNA glycosylase
MALVSHLGMSGSFRIEADDEGSLKPGVFHHRARRTTGMTMSVFHIDGPAGQARVIYNDPRRFGYMDLMARSALADHPWFRSLGVEPTGNSLDAHELAGRLAGKTAPLKAALLDPGIIAGLGNIYVCEAMWRARPVTSQAGRRLVTRTGQPRKALERDDPGDTRRDRRGDCRGWLVAEGPYPDRRHAGLFPARIFRL